jgi:hypothetical protein
MTDTKAPILQLRSTGATCYPLSNGKHLMCGTARDGEAYACVVTLHMPESLEVVEVGTKPRDLKVEDLLEHLRQAGESMAEMVPYRPKYGGAGQGGTTPV